MSYFEAGRKKARSEDRAVLLEARDHLQRVVSEYQDDELTPKATLYLGRVLVKLEDWPAAKEALVMINKNKDWLDKLGRAESIFLYGLCLEKLGEIDDAIKVYDATIGVFGAYSEWSLQALERGFEIAYSSDDPELKLKPYRYMKKLLYMFQNFEDALGSGGSLERLYERRDTVRVELGITAEQESEIDRKAAQMMSGQALPIPGKAYLNHLNFILQSMIGVFMMIVTLTIRRFGRERK